MIKWHQIDKNILNDRKNVTLMHSDNKIEYEAIAKKILGLKIDKELKDFNFELSVFGRLSECFFAAQFISDIDAVQDVLVSGEAIPIAVAFENDAYKDELLNLFNKEDENKPSLDMLREFIKSKMHGFQVLNEHDAKFWIAEWSNVNSWGCYWQSNGKFHCLAKMSG